MAESKTTKKKLKEVRFVRNVTVDGKTYKTDETAKIKEEIYQKLLDRGLV